MMSLVMIMLATLKLMMSLKYLLKLMAIMLLTMMVM